MAGAGGNRWTGQLRRFLRDFLGYAGSRGLAAAAIVAAAPCSKASASSSSCRCSASSSARRTAAASIDAAKAAFNAARPRAAARATGAAARCLQRADDRPRLGDGGARCPRCRTANRLCRSVTLPHRRESRRGALGPAGATAPRPRHAYHERRHRPHRRDGLSNPAMRHRRYAAAGARRAGLSAGAGLGLDLLAAW